jgi:3-hydroxyisobutyrate dehydrogenase-like beta-hydroxyacid dehydrogenase
MSPIGPKRSASPMLLGGPHAEAFGELAAALGLSGARHFAAVVGRASAAKMCRSVVVKGMEALLAESLLAARSYGVEASVLASLGDLLPAADWEQRAIYMMSRSVQHGLRRAEEMREVAKTVADAGIEPWMSSACAERQQWAAACAPLDAGLLLPDFLDAVLRRPTVAPEDPA